MSARSPLKWMQPRSPQKQADLAFAISRAHRHDDVLCKLDGAPARVLKSPSCPCAACVVWRAREASAVSVFEFTALEQQ